ncbi:MAG: hypothetical protein ACYDAL_14255 [Candidatus Dormibacteraceae bacterium]
MSAQPSEGTTHDCVGELLSDVLPALAPEEVGDAGTAATPSHRGLGGEDQRGLAVATREMTITFCPDSIRAVSVFSSDLRSAKLSPVTGSENSKGLGIPPLAYRRLRYASSGSMIVIHRSRLLLAIPSVEQIEEGDQTLHGQAGLLPGDRASGEPAEDSDSLVDQCLALWA